MAWRRYSEYTESVDNVRAALQDSYANHEFLLDAMFENRFHNARLDIWQRGTSFTSGASQFTADRFRFKRGSAAAGATLSRQAGFNGAKYCARVQRDNTNALTNPICFGQQFDSDECGDFAGRNVYVIADIRAGANFSAASSQVRCKLYTGTGSNETIDEAAGFATGGASSSALKAISTTASTIVFGPFAVPSNATEFAAVFDATPVGMAGAADYFEITNIRLSLDAPLLFKPRPLAVEEAICYRFFELVPNSKHGTATGRIAGLGVRASTTSIVFPIACRVKKRVSPSFYTTTPTWATADANSNTIAAVLVGAGSFITITGALSINLQRHDVGGGELVLTAGTSFSGSANDACRMLLNGACALGLDAEI